MSSEDVFGPIMNYSGAVLCHIEVKIKCDTEFSNCWCSVFVIVTVAWGYFFYIELQHSSELIPLLIETMRLYFIFSFLLLNPIWIQKFLKRSLRYQSSTRMLVLLKFGFRVIIAVLAWNRQTEEEGVHVSSPCWLKLKIQIREGQNMRYNSYSMPKHGNIDPSPH